MNNILELLIIAIIAVVGFTIIYRLLPFRTWNPNKPIFTLFPKYVATFEKPVSEIESNLEEIRFKKISNNIFTRGKIYGDFSANLIKLTAEVDENNKQVKVFASFFGVLFDNGDIWKVTAEIINGKNP